MLKQNEAKLLYRDGDYKILNYGTYVPCAVTGKPIPLQQLEYWNVDKQEAYSDAQASYQAFITNKAQPL